MMNAFSYFLFCYRERKFTEEYKDKELFPLGTAPCFTENKINYFAFLASLIATISS